MPADTFSPLTLLGVEHVVISAGSCKAVNPVTVLSSSRNYKVESVTSDRHDCHF